MNNAAVDKGSEVEKVAIPAEWAKIKVKKAVDTRDILNLFGMLSNLLIR